MLIKEYNMSYVKFNLQLIIKKMICEQKSSPSEIV